MPDRSCIMIVNDANKAVVNKVLARIFGDPPASDNLSVPLSANAQLPASHWCNHIWRTEEQAGVLEALPTGGGTLPTFADGLDWDDFGTTELAVLAAIAAPNVTTYIATGGVPLEHLEGVLSGRGLQRVDFGD